MYAAVVVSLTNIETHSLQTNWWLHCCGTTNANTNTNTQIQMMYAAVIVSLTNIKNPLFENKLVDLRLVDQK